MSLTRFHCANSLGLLGRRALGGVRAKIFNRHAQEKKKKSKVIGTGFEPVPPKRLVPETSALDRSATQPLLGRTPQWCQRKFFFQNKNMAGKKKLNNSKRTKFWDGSSRLGGRAVQGASFRY